MKIITMLMFSFFRSICVKDQLSTVMPQIMQLEEGLSSCNILSSARKHSKIWQPIFLQSGYNYQFTPDEFLDQVIPEFSSSQIDKNKEINVYFCDFVVSLNNSDGRYNFSQSDSVDM